MVCNYHGYYGSTELIHTLQQPHVVGMENDELLKSCGREPPSSSDDAPSSGLDVDTRTLTQLTTKRCRDCVDFRVEGKL